MKRSAVATLQIGFWVVYLILVLVILGALYGEGEAADAKIEKSFNSIFFFALLPSALSFYTFYYFLFPRFLRPKKYWLTVVYGWLTALLSALIGYGILSEINKNEMCSEDEVGTFFGMTAFMTFIALISGVIAFVMKGFVTWFEETKQKEALMEKNHQMEVALVKSQLDPHFLFNTINNIDVLILKDAEKASDYLNHLSDIMRFMLFETKTDEIFLSKEIEYIEKYIELQRIRTANELYVNFSVSGEAGNKKIAPMLFIPFIENAFKHTNNKKIENAIAIAVEIEAEKIILKCSNKFDPTRSSNQESHGLGNVLIKKRIELLYPNQHDLTIEHGEDFYKVCLVINHG